MKIKLGRISEKRLAKVENVYTGAGEGQIHIISNKRVLEHDGWPTLVATWWDMGMLGHWWEIRVKAIDEIIA